MNPTPERIKELESHSAMLGQIAGYVEEFAIDDEMTTLECVRWVVASYKKLLAEKELDSIMEKVNARHRD
jgi:hypothetical protein